MFTKPKENKFQEKMKPKFFHGFFHGKLDFSRKHFPKCVSMKYFVW